MAINTIKTKTIEKVFDNNGRLLREEITHFRDIYETTIDSEGVAHLRKIGKQEIIEITENDYIYKF